ncbi:MAG TPA: hypothetical protein VG708_15870 [Mycobacteriales bacterium]|nr:hypothetical protein [Mycobacteriales bacterium]
MILAAVLGLGAIAGGVAAGEPFAGPLVCAGLMLGGWNARRLWDETTKLEGSPGDARRAMAMAGLRRLGFITLIAVLIALVYRRDGWAVFVGLVAFQLLMMSMLLGPLRRVIAPHDPAHPVASS